MNTKKPVFPALWIGLVALLVIQGALLSGCGQFEAWRNDSPEITTLTLPKEVRYGETVTFKVRVFDAENDDRRMGSIRGFFSWRSGSRD